MMCSIVEYMCNIEIGGLGISLKIIITVCRLRHYCLGLAIVAPILSSYYNIYVYCIFNIIM